MLLVRDCVSTVNILANYKILKPYSGAVVSTHGQDNVTESAGLIASLSNYLKCNNSINYNYSSLTLCKPLCVTIFYGLDFNRSYHHLGNGYCLSPAVCDDFYRKTNSEKSFYRQYAKSATKLYAVSFSAKKAI